MTLPLYGGKLILKNGTIANGLECCCGGGCSGCCGNIPSLCDITLSVTRSNTGVSTYTLRGNDAGGWSWLDDNEPPGNFAFGDCSTSLAAKSELCDETPVSTTQFSCCCLSYSESLVGCSGCLHPSNCTLIATVTFANGTTEEIIWNGEDTGSLMTFDFGPCSVSAFYGDVCNDEFGNPIGGASYRKVQNLICDECCSDGTGKNCRLGDITEEEYRNDCGDILITDISFSLECTEATDPCNNTQCKNQASYGFAKFACESCCECDNGAGFKFFNGKANGCGIVDQKFYYTENGTVCTPTNCGNAGDAITNIVWSSECVDKQCCILNNAAISGQTVSFTSDCLCGPYLGEPTNPGSTLNGTAQFSMIQHTIDGCVEFYAQPNVDANCADLDEVQEYAHIFISCENCADVGCAEYGGSSTPNDSCIRIGFDSYVYNPEWGGATSYAGIVCGNSLITINDQGIIEGTVSIPLSLGEGYPTICTVTVTFGG